MKIFEIRKPLKVLIVEDFDDDVEMIIDQFQRSDLSIEHITANNRKEFEARLHEMEFDAALVDYTLDDLDGLEAMEMLRQKDQYIPVIFVTGTLGVEKAVNVMQQGANDFILKKNMEDLPKSVFKAIRESFELREKARIHNILKESERRFREMADSAPVLMLILNHQRRIEFFNKPWEDFTGITIDTLKSTWLELIHPEDKQRVLQKIDEAYLAKSSTYLEFRLKKHSGDYRWMLNWYNPIIDDRGILNGFNGALIDITDQKIIDHQKNQFLSVASHELKTPLSTVKAYLELLKDELNGDGDLQMYADKAENSANKMQNLIHELIDLSRFENGHIELHHTMIDFDDMMANLVDEFSAASKKHSIKLIGSTGATIEGDEGKLTQVFSNLFSNAIKYSPDANHIDVTLKQVDGKIEVTVKDYGIGIDKKYHDKVFTRFFRVNTIAHLFSGLGIGLFLTRQLIRLHGGDITMDSTPGEGSEFIVTLPVD